MAILTTSGGDTTQTPSLSMVEPYTATPTFQPGVTQNDQNYIAPGAYRPEESDTVEGRMTGLLSSGSKYMENARTKGEQFAQSRGLLNSSLAGEASQKAAIESALPIAQQDSAAITNAGLAHQDYEQKAGLVDLQAGASSQLSAQEANQNMGQTAYKEQMASNRHQSELEMSQMLKQMGLASDEIKAIGSSVTLLGQSLADQIASIQRDPSLNSGAKSTIINQLTDQYRANVESVARIYNVPITWETPVAA